MSDALRGIVALGLWLVLGVFTICTILSWGGCTPAPLPAPTQGVANTPEGSEKKGGSSDTTPAPTAAPTPTPTPTPKPTATPEPTATPIPEGWYIDPNGIIPPEVEVLVWDQQTVGNTKYCITRVNGKATLQQWIRGKGLEKEWEVPENLTEAVSMYIYNPDDYISVRGFHSENYAGHGPQLYYYESNNGEYLYVDSKAVFTASIGEAIHFVTTDNKYIVYSWGNTYYKFYDLGSDSQVEIIGKTIYVDGEWFDRDKATLTVAPLPKK